MAVSNNPTGALLFLESIIATISNPPEVPENLKMRAIPTPPMNPPKMVESRISSATVVTGHVYKKILKDTTQSSVEYVIRFPNVKKPRMRSGKFKRKFKRPMLNGLMSPIRIAIPLIPLLKIP